MKTLKKLDHNVSKATCGGMTFVEIIFVIAITAFLAFGAPKIYRLLTGKASTPSTAPTNPSPYNIPMPEPKAWTHYQHFPAFVDKYKTQLSQWESRTTGPGTSGPRILSTEERKKIIAELIASFPQIIQHTTAANPPQGASPVIVGLYVDEYGSAILGGGLQISNFMTPVAVLKNDGTLVELKNSTFKAERSYLWHRPNQQHIVMLGRLENVTTDPNKIGSGTRKVIVDGQESSGNFELVNVYRPDMAGIAIKELGGDFNNPPEIDPNNSAAGATPAAVVKFSGYWSKNKFDQPVYRPSMNGEYVSELQISVDY